MFRSIRLFITAALTLMIAACTSTLPEGGEMRYARWLTMGDSTATVLNPWRPGEVLHSYPLPQAGEAYSRAVSATSLHAYLAYRLGALDHLAGVMDADYIVAPELKAAIATKAPASTESATKAPASTESATKAPASTESVPKAPASTESVPPFPAVDGGATLADMGSSQSPNLERIKAAGADLIFASPFENAGYGQLETLGIPIVECADYMEATPLGRAEWMRFYGRLLGRAEKADSLFAAEEEAYATLCSLRRVAEPQPQIAPQASPHLPTLLLGKRSGQAWYVPGGQSYLGTLLHDADAHYVFADEASTGSVPLDFEAVYSRAKDADLWLITYAAPPAEDGTFVPLTYAALAAEDERYAQFRAFREHHIWACNTLEVPYYDALPWTPAALLRDVILIAHPERFPGEKPHYFRPLE